MCMDTEDTINDIVDSEMIHATMDESQATEAMSFVDAKKLRPMRIHSKW